MDRSCTTSGSVLTKGIRRILQRYFGKFDRVLCGVVPMVGIYCRTLSLEMDDHGRVVSLRNRATNYEFLSAQSQPVGLWQMGIMRKVSYTDPLPPLDIPTAKYEGHEWFANRDEYKADIEIDSDSLPQPDVFTNTGNVILKWRIPVPGGDGTLVVSIAGGDRDRFEFRSRVSLPDGWVLKRLTLPRIRGLGDLEEPDEDALLYPETWGVLRRNPLEDMTSYCGQYPSHANWCQMTAWLHGEDGLYAGMLDPFSSHTGIDVQYVEGSKPAPIGDDYRLWHEGRQSVEPVQRRPLRERIESEDRPSMQLRFQHWPSMTNEWNSPYPVVLQGFAGGWYEAAKIHRGWATKQRWCRRGRLWDRKDASQALASVDLWFSKYGFPPWSSTPEPASEFQESISRLQEAFLMPFGVHWYHWHAFNWHSRYPDHSPVVDGFGEVVKDLQDQGIVIMPYCQGRLLYRDRPTFESERTHAGVGAGGQPYMEMYTGKDDWPLALCPGAAWSRQQWVAAARMLWREYSVDGVYFDQIASMPPSLCYHTGHGHALGGGNQWWHGYDQFFGDITALIQENPRRFVASELMADAYLDRIDLYLTFVPQVEDYVPLHPAIYGGYTTVMGRSTPSAVMGDMQLLALTQAEQMLFGGQLGWMNDDILEYPAAVGYIRDLARMRSGLRKFLHYGSLEEPMEVRQPHRLKITLPREYAMKPRPVVIDRPAVRHTVWRAPDGEWLVLLLNETGKETVAQLELPEHLADVDWQVTRLGSTESTALVSGAGQVDICFRGYEMVALVGSAR